MGMTRVSREFVDGMQKQNFATVSAEVMFASSRFSSYKFGANNQIMDAKDDSKVLSVKEVAARETAILLEQQKWLSVCDLASKFEKGLPAAAKLSEEAKLSEAVSLEKHVILKKLRDALEALKGLVAGRNKEDVEEAIAMAEALAVKLTQRGGELIQEKAEASEDAKKLVEEERSFARAEIESARAAIQRVEEALQEDEHVSRASGKQDIEELLKEVQEARRIKMLHQLSKVMDMEHELRALQSQLVEKSKRAIELQKEFAGATKPVYSPEPYIVGRTLQADIVLEGQHVTLSTTGAIEGAPGLGSYVEALVRKHDTEFNICGVRGGSNAGPQALFWQVKNGTSYRLASESEKERNVAIMLARRFAYDCNIRWTLQVDLAFSHD